MLIVNNLKKNYHTLKDEIKTLNNIFFNEFVIEVNNSDKFLSNLKSAGILGGIKLDNNKILVCTTEMNSEYELEQYVNSI